MQLHFVIIMFTSIYVFITGNHFFLHKYSTHETYCGLTVVAARE